MDTQRIPVLIPALNPDEKLLRLLLQLKENGIENVVLVDDGSGPDAQAVFEAAQKGGAVVLRHAQNLGKGRALKTAFNHLLLHQPGLLGAITADADGQHSAHDILRCGEALESNPCSLIMGCRDFVGDNVPAKNRMGNRITSRVMGFLCGVKVSDTQTGLRAIPAEFMRRLMNVPGERFEYETSMLLETNDAKVPIVEVPIETIYIEENQTSHFNPLRDSLRIYSLFLRFIMSSLFSSLVDILLFSLFVALFKDSLPGYIFVATVLARVISALVNYWINRNKVFKSSKKTSSTFVKYFVLSAVQMMCSALLVTALYTLWPFNEVIEKAIVDVVLFFVSFQIQKRFVF